MISIENYHKLLEKYKIEVKGRHLMLPKDHNLSDRKKNQLVKDLFEALGDERANKKEFKLLKKRDYCSSDLCVSPQCYTFTVMSNVRFGGYLDKEDIIDIAETIDLQDVYRKGIKNYLEEYNLNQPDILKLTMGDFKLVLSYLKGNNNAD